MAKQKTSKDKTLRTKDDQMKFIHDYAAYFTERIWEILDEYNVSYNVDYDSEKETIEEAMAKMFNDMHIRFYGMFAGYLTSILAIEPHPEIQKDQNKILMEWFNKQKEGELKFLSDSRAKKFQSIIKSKTEN